MGGIGSGRHWHHSAKALTDDYRKLDVRRWAREGLLHPGSKFGWRWTRHGRSIGDIRVSVETSNVRLMYRAREHGIEWRDWNYPVRLDWTDCHHGGFRAWFRCPAQGCSRRVALLYGGLVFACRHCHGLAYPVQRENSWQRAMRRADKLAARLGGDEPGSETDKPKGMHWRTYHRLAAEAEAAQTMAVGGLVRHFRGDPASLALIQNLYLER